MPLLRCCGPSPLVPTSPPGGPRARPECPRLAASGRPPQARDPARREDRAEEVPRGRARAVVAARLRGPAGRPHHADHREDPARRDRGRRARRADRASCRSCGRGSAWSTRCWSSCRPPRYGTSGCSATNGRSARSSTTTSCPTPRPVDLCLILDPMLATGGSATAAIEVLKKWGAVTPVRIKLVNLIAAPGGRRGGQRRPPGRRHPLRGARPPAQRQGLHHARPRRRRRPPVRDRPLGLTRNLGET